MPVRARAAVRPVGDGPVRGRRHGAPRAGLPGLAAPCARLACAMHSVVRAGDHAILIGRVLAAHVNEDRLPLVYCDRLYAYPAPVPSRALAQALLTAGSAW